MPKSDYTEIVVILDRSGSMAPVRTDMEGGFNSFIKAQRELPGECKVSLYQFDSHYEVVYQGKNLKDVPSLVLNPGGNTALYDAVGRTIASTGERFAAMKENKRPDKVMVLIITDGAENASCEYTAERLKEMVDHQTTKYSWQFVYLGCDASALTTANRLGIQNFGSYHHTSKGTSNLFNTVSNNTAVYRASGPGGSCTSSNWNSPA